MGTYHIHMIDTPESESVLDVLRASECEALTFIQYHLGVLDVDGEEDIRINPQRHPLQAERYRAHGEYLSEAHARHDLEMVGAWANVAADRGRLTRWYSSVNPIEPPF